MFIQFPARVFNLLAAVGMMVFISGIGHAEVKTKTVTYRDGDVECQGYLAWDDAKPGARPGVLVVHEWWGLNDYAKDRCRQLAELGYVAFAADMYGNGKVTKHPMEAGGMASEVRMNQESWRRRGLAGLKALQSQPECNPQKVAAIGYCFGGSTALQLAFSGADLKAVASFHGALPVPTNDDVKNVKAKILVCHGGDDSFIPAEVVAGFQEKLKAGDVALQFVSYPGVKHSFTVKDADSHMIPGLKYDEKADQDSWSKLKTLFAEVFK